ncbi:WXG100 family type VII secretion target [Rhodococcus triatomae]|uniref:ESAT-6-like protein n=1 Tax=Rhodococcus triatomae TaxID=300028 RepID=A0A1G8AH71_9NOCA|nr:WXG100 family type VII secretion target [Rhodococcus triatomae]QNG17768.1 WXG100 family type VII secretion target [Rhodococcus triatomae]QNG22564.1 WXG100 family type VII secretion target [Rhodococcus triatomae]SDH20298.1 WXG100 family type VII secretion target [Rhodococcus triatomae]
MGDHSLEVSVERLQAASSFVGGRADDLRTDLDALTKAVEDLLDDGWQGVAAEAFSAAWEEWRDGARQVSEAFAESSVLLSDTAGAYEDQDQDHATAITSLNGLV